MLTVMHRGFSSGYFIKKSSKIIAFVAGGMFIFVQFLGSQGYVTLNYQKLSKDFEVINCNYLLHLSPYNMYHLIAGYRTLLTSIATVESISLISTLLIRR
jgi:hypothetical protein